MRVPMKMLLCVLFGPSRSLLSSPILRKCHARGRKRSVEGIMSLFLQVLNCGLFGDRGAYFVSWSSEVSANNMRTHCQVPNGFVGVMGGMVNYTPEMKARVRLEKPIRCPILEKLFRVRGRSLVVGDWLCPGMEREVDML